MVLCHQRHRSKIFNQESALKPTINADANNRSNKLRERSVFEVNHDTEVSSTIKLDEIQTPDMSRKQASFEVLFGFPH
ncbi:hypothetical protein Dimus_032147 [Dionaea muscipula]